MDNFCLPKRNRRVSQIQIEVQKCTDSSRLYEHVCIYSIIILKRWYNSNVVYISQNAKKLKYRI